MISEVCQDAGKGFKTNKIILEAKIRKAQRHLSSLKKLEFRARQKWTKGYHAYLGAARELTKIKLTKSKKRQTLNSIINNWDDSTVKLTKERDAIRLDIEKTNIELATLSTRLAVLTEQQQNNIKTDDEIIKQVFQLNEVAVQASRNREDYLTDHLFHRLGEDENKNTSQITLTSSNGLRRVIVLVNSITIVQPDLAAQAQDLIRSFFDQFKKDDSELPVDIKPFYEISSQLLIEKTKFKVGQTLYRFLAMNLNKEVCQELVSAQALLRASIRSEKTTKYIRIYERKSHSDKWELIKQS